MALAACKPPPSDAAIARATPEAEPTYASSPLPSPETEDAIWAVSQKPDRIIYGVPAQPALIALECLIENDGPRVKITRMAPADEEAEALLALVGNGALGRIEVDATELGSSIYWQGEIAASDRNLEPLLGPRRVTATIPGAGLVELNPSPLPGAFLGSCTAGEQFIRNTPDETDISESDGKNGKK